MDFIESTIKRDVTERLSCRKGEFLIWFSWKSIWAEPKSSILIMNIWELKDGDFITITNRYEDLPSWLDLYPTEVKGRLVRKVIDTFNEGHYPDQPVVECNLMRVKTGDRLVILSEKKQRIIAITENSFVIGENSKDEKNVFINFGAVFSIAGNPKIVDKAREVQDYICELGMPREIDTEWRIG